MIYQHRVQYYETDRMGVTHHSNYIRFMEEARGYIMEQWGWPYAKCEKMGLMCPVISLNNIEYKNPTTYDDVIDIHVFVLDCERVRLRIGYHMYVGDKLVFKGESGHVFLNTEGRPVSLKRSYPELYQLYVQHMEAQGEF